MVRDDFYSLVERLITEKMEKEYGIVKTSQPLRTFYLTLKRRSKKLGMSVVEYMSFLENSEEEQYWLLNTLLIGYTRFNRHPEQFRFYVGVLEKNFKGTSKPVDIWSSGCSTGEEPYSIAIWTVETLGKDHPFRVLASDVNEIALRKARKGIYKKRNLKNIPDVFFKYLNVRKISREYIIEVKDVIKNRVDFKNINMVKDEYPNREFDFVFCRNVFLYMKPSWQEKVIRCFYRVLKPGGYLFTGSAETFISINVEFERVGGGIFRKPSEFQAEEEKEKCW